MLDGQWTDIASITFPDSDQGKYTKVTLDYLTDYAIEFLNRDDNHAASLNYPVSLFYENEEQNDGLCFLDDIIPSGASRRYWIRHLGIEKFSNDQQNFVLLKYGTIAPVGNLRIKESLPNDTVENDIMTFSEDEIANRAVDFLEYAERQGAAVGGATGAGGEAPKLLLRCNGHHRLWIDTYQNDPNNQDTAYLVKFPRGQRGETDCNILRTEFHYYHELEAMGFNTISTDHMRLIEGDNFPSLWLPRFDVYITPNGQQHYGIESVYSLLCKAPGTSLDHEETIRTLITKINHSNMVLDNQFVFDQDAFIIEWIRRDLLNIIFGNSDNHGRNTSFLKGENCIKLAPIYDFAPMKADPEGITRTTKWNRSLEMGGEYDFHKIAETLADLLPPETLISALRITANQLLGLKERLYNRGVPEQILKMPGLSFDYIDQKLKRWGLL